ncbi:MAG: hypothetical protein ACTSR0_00830 [Candidatus Asgardarchaeia archaeon]
MQNKEKIASFVLLSFLVFSFGLIYLSGQNQEATVSYYFAGGDLSTLAQGLNIEEDWDYINFTVWKIVWIPSDNETGNASVTHDFNKTVTIRSDGNLELLEKLPVDPGTYSKLKLLVRNVEVCRDGRIIAIWYAMTIHINFTSPLEIESGEEYKIVTTLDFRAAGHTIHALVEIIKVSTDTVVISEPGLVS